MNVFIVLVLTLFGTKASLPPTVLPWCHSGKLVGSLCVKFSAQKMTHDDAAQSCHANFKGNLMEIKTDEMYKALAELASESGQKMWVGAKKVPEGEWSWLSDKSSATLPKKMFAWGEPNNWGGNEECLQMKPNGKLNDAACGRSFAFACVFTVTP